MPKYGVGVPKGEVAHSAEEAEAVAKTIGTADPLFPTRPAESTDTNTRQQ